MNTVKHGFGPIFDNNSKLLILGSFPSVKSRQIDFYYGNKQNRFWRTLCSFFLENVPETTDGKKQFLLKYGIALWDVVEECEIVGSKDSTIKNYKIADIEKLLQNSKICFIILNGGTAYNIFIKHFPQISERIKIIKLTSTSPANTRFGCY